MLKIRRPLGRLIFNMGIAIPGKTVFLIETAPWVSFQYRLSRLIARSREVPKPRDLYLELLDCSDVWQAPRQHCCRRACQISKRCDNFNYQSRGLETSRDLMILRLTGYWNGAQFTVIWKVMTPSPPPFTATPPQPPPQPHPNPTWRHQPMAQ